MLNIVVAILTFFLVVWIFFHSLGSGCPLSYGIINSHTLFHTEFVVVQVYVTWSPSFSGSILRSNNHF